MDVNPTDAEPLWVACLCAQWCGTCRDYRAVFEGLQAEFGARLRCIWVDIEDEADELGDIDVDDFPTLLIARGDAVLFFGPLTPQPQTLSRLVQSALAGALPAVTDTSSAELPARVRALRR